MNEGLNKALCGMTTVLDENLAEVAVEDLVKDTDCIGLYFSAHWCPPCRGFTPVLADFYKTLKAKGGSIEVIFISSDRDEASFKEYFGTMPWHALKFGQPEKQTLGELYGVRGIPSLIILDKNGAVKDSNGRGTVQANPSADSVPSSWK
ncbi:uncharacterized protein LOC125668781 [Ostrea edulis]|uniref:uncharacterized protein LOC125668781 n=1 Tax=Ostrea edulis TaxID=37623 RepID=UPI0020948E02|nr:uncharacterized protein LOC125668781 [Ostrea edulis]